MLATRSGRTWPTVPIVLGLGGLIPFVGLALLAVTGAASRFGVPADMARAALLAYGAVIASFLGGIRWGVALRESGRASALDLVLSVVPSLIAWASLALPRPFDAGALGLLLLAWGAVDQDLPRRGLAPAWFGRLRIILSGVAGIAMWVAALG